MKSGFVTIIGRPNVGKSTLLNQVVSSSLSIVTPKAQTTRDCLQGILTTEKGQIVFVDTPGVHTVKAGGLNEYMVNEAKRALEAPSLVWYMIDPQSALEHELRVIECLVERIPHPTPIFLIINKSDLPQMNPTQEQEIYSTLTQKGYSTIHRMKISAKNKTGIDLLMEKTWDLIEEGPMYYPDPEVLSDRPLRYFVSEKIREHIFLELNQELPYSCAVEINEFKENQAIPKIEATIFVERDSQKGIVIGKNASMLKRIGQAARLDIEKMMEKKIFLGLKVKILKDWSKSPSSLKTLGYAPQEVHL